MSLPTWLDPVVALNGRLAAEDLTRFTPPAEGGRPSAVLILFGESERGPDLLLIERAHDMRSHAGQPAFPGGALEDDDAGPVDAALREAAEETGLDPAGVDVIGTLPDLWVPVSGFVVTPVLAWWRKPSVVTAHSPEVASVHRVAISDLVDPANRVRVRHPSGYVGPGFEVNGLLVWGFTGGLLSRMLDLTGWAVPWSDERVVPVE